MNGNSNARLEVATFPMIARILRNVPDENAFYFYKEIGYYLDVRSRSLGQFLEDLKTINVFSIEFHSKRGDFENWFLTTLGDATLARQVHSCRTKEGENLRNSLISLVAARLTRLHKFH